MIQTLATKFNVPIGYSGHEENLEISLAVASMGVSSIERHLTLDKNMEGPDHKASLEPDDLRAMVKAIRNIELALGNGLKQPSKSEIKNIENCYCLYPTVGENLDYLNSNNLKIDFLYRNLDQLAWQYCNKGFFNFKNYIPKIISNFN